MTSVLHRGHSFSYGVRGETLEAIRSVDLVIPEETWEQKVRDIEDCKLDVVVMGSDWEGDLRFEALKGHCEVVCLDRTDGVSATDVKKELKK